MKVYVVLLVFCLLATPTVASAQELASREPAAKDQVNLNDKDVSKTEKKLDEIQTKQANTFVRQQAEVLNSVPGVNVTPQELVEKPAKKGISLNPISWIFAPVIKLQEQTVRLQQQMMKLTGPIAALQPAMLTLQNRVESMGGQMTDVQKELKGVKEKMSTISGRLDETVTHMKGVDKNMGNVSTQMSTVQNSLSGTYAELRRMRPDIANVRADIGRIRDPIMTLQKPLIAMAEPINNLDNQVTGVHEQISQIREPLVKMEKPITSLEKELSGLSSDIAGLRSLLSMVLTSIFIAAGLIAVGTPIAGILIWRNKNKILPKPKAGESSEDDLVSTKKQPVSSRR